MPPKRTTLLLVAVIVVLELIQEGLFQWSFGQLSVSMFLAYYHRAVVRDLLALLWFLLCKALQLSGETLLQYFRNEVHTTSDPVLVINQYQTLWLQLSRLARRTGSTFSNSFGIYLLYLFTILTVTIYNIMSSMIAEISFPAFSLIVQATTTGILLFIICDSANSACCKFGSLLITYLVVLFQFRKSADVRA
ncbi:gustatory and odorant receptor 63a-like [Anabrus simplex]|uniref:gustatory and odorant receptor 63a-like n=1 Tax=Anabrus simplex TaxID=316456 RepID=UPI0035A39233